ncbi:HNH endonuclease [Variovorax sp. V116]|uniref:HNH endonuclease n=1 Tax=Variovorax sp. V116 TaxID=3065953 RepID=UPI0034E8A264
MRARHLQSLRRAACREQGGVCYYCLQPMRGDVTAEHLQARRDGGKDTRENIVAAHRLCNSRRHQLFPIEAPEPAAYANLIALARVAGFDLEDLAQARSRRISTGPVPL